MLYLGKLHFWDLQKNKSILKEDNIDNQFLKSTKSITNLIYNQTRSTLAVCYVDNVVTLLSFGQQKSELTVCYLKFFIHIVQIYINLFIQICMLFFKIYIFSL